MPDRAFRARTGCDDKVGAPCPPLPCDGSATLVVRASGWPQGAIARRAATERWTACRGPLGARTMAADRVDRIRGDQFRYAEAAPRYGTPRGAHMRYWSGSSVEIHVRVDGALLKVRPDCYWFGVDLLRFELVASVLPGTGMEGRKLHNDRKSIEAPEDQDAFMWFNELDVGGEDAQGIVPFDAMWLQSSILRLPENFRFEGCLPVAAVGHGGSSQECHHEPRRAGYLEPAELVTFERSSSGPVLRGDDGAGRRDAVLAFAFASDLCFFANELGRVLDRNGRELWAVRPTGSFPVMWYNIDFEAVFVYRAWAIDHRGEECTAWPFGVRVGFTGRSRAPRRGLPADVVAQGVPVVAEQHVSESYKTSTPSALGGLVYKQPPQAGEYAGQPQSDLASCALGGGVDRIELEVGTWPRLFHLEVGPSHLVLPELTDRVREPVPRDVPILALKPGTNRSALPMAVLPHIGWRGHPFLDLPVPPRTDVRFRRDSLRVDRDTDAPRETAEGGPTGAWTEILTVVIETQDGQAFECEVLFLLERIVRCLPMPNPRRSEYDFEKIMAMQCSCVARIGKERTEFVFTPDLGQFGSPAFMAAHAEVVGADGSVSYVSRSTGIRYGAPQPQSDRDCVWEERGDQTLLRILADFTPLAPFFLAYEAFSGRSWSSGIELSKTERVFAGVGVAVSVLGHVGILRRLRAWRAQRAEQRSLEQFQDIVDDFLLESKLSGQTVKREELLEFLEGASTLEDTHIAAIEKVSEIVRKNPDARGSDALDAIRKGLSQSEMAEYAEAAARITHAARARRVMALLNRESKHLSNAERAAFETFVRAGQLPAESVGRLKVVGRGVVLELSSETYDTAHALARRGRLVVVPGSGAPKAAAEEVFKELLGFDVRAMGGKVLQDVVGRTPRGKVVTVEVYRPSSAAWHRPPVKSLPGLSKKLKNPQALHIVVEAADDAPLSTVLTHVRLTLQNHVALHGPPKFRSLSVLHKGVLSIVPGSRELEEAFGYVLLGVVEQAAPVVGHAPLLLDVARGEPAAADEEAD